MSWCGNILGAHSFCRVSGGSPETLLELCVFTKSPHQEDRWNYGNFCSDSRFCFIVYFTDEPSKTYENGTTLTIRLVWHKKHLIHNKYSVTKIKLSSF